MHIYYEDGFIWLAYRIGARESNSGWLHTRQAKISLVVQSIRLDASAVPSGCLSPENFRGRCWSLVCTGRPRKLDSDVGEGWWQLSRQDRCGRQQGLKQWAGYAGLFSPWTTLGCCQKVLPALREGFPHSVNPSWERPHRPTQRRVS